jgi:hypothetical protein
LREVKLLHVCDVKQLGQRCLRIDLAQPGLICDLAMLTRSASLERPPPIEQ